MRIWSSIAGALLFACATAVAAAAGRQAAPDQRPGTPRDEHHATRGDHPDTLIRPFAAFGDHDVQIGATIRDLDSEQGRTITGAVVDEVREDSPAAKAGLKAGDVVTEYDGERVRSAKHLSRLVAETAPGHTVKAAVMRNGSRVDLQITPERGEMAWMGGDRLHVRPGQPEFGMDMPRFDFDYRMPNFERRMPGDGRDFEFFITPGRGRLGVTVEDLTSQLAQYFGAKDGVLVTSVAADSPAARAGLKAGDVITAVNDKPVATPAELAAEVRQAQDGAALRLTYVRDKKTASATATLPARERPKRPSEPV
jgi:serine protease Do